MRYRLYDALRLFPDGQATSSDGNYDHSPSCPHQYVVEVRNTYDQDFWIAGAEAAGEWPDNEFDCNGIYVTVGTYGLAPFAGWQNYFNYSYTGDWVSGRYGYYCATVYDPSPPPVAPTYYSKVRAAVRVSSYFGVKLKARGGTLQ